MRLDRLYIQSRYPNGFDVGSPKDYFTKKDAAEALEMPSESSRIAKVSFLDGAAAIQALTRLSRNLLARHPEAFAVILFGSLARGDYAPGSDADLLIILEADDRRMIDRIPDYLREFLDAPVPPEVFPYTSQELERMRASGNWFVERALAEGIVLAERRPRSDLFAECRSE